MQNIPQIRRARREDLPAIVEIYNQAVLRTTATFDTDPKTEESQVPWWNHHGQGGPGDRHPIYVAELGGKVAGWASLSSFSDRCAYGQTAENSLYIHEDFRGKGLGRQLLAVLMDHARGTDLLTVISRIAGDNEVSLRLHHEAGFVTRGILKDVGFKFGRLLDVHYLQWMKT